MGGPDQTAPDQQPSGQQPPGQQPAGDAGGDGEGRRRSSINPPVFFVSAAVIVAFVAFGASAPEFAGTLFSSIQAWITGTFGWLYMLAVAVFVVFTAGLAVSSHGRVKLGPNDSRPEFGYTAWFAMLFSAGMGIGLMFFGVAEPVMHYSSPPVGEGGDIAAARAAMSITFFHWGLHAWAIYAVVGLALAYFAFRHGLPLTIRSALFPLIGDRIHGPIGHAADIFAVFGTMFGVATSLGLGVMQVGAGLNYLFDIPNTVGTQILLIVGITCLAIISVVAGLHAGIKRLSQLNLILALFLLLFVALAGPTLFLFQAFVQNTGAYLNELVGKTFMLFAYEPTDWIGGWTLFYWAWWIAWSPFVGMFIARVSRGRTIREFVLGVLFVPVGFTFAWLTVFGNTAIALDMGAAAGAIAQAVSADVSTALFQFLERLPLSAITSLVATVLVITFFVTSSDSGSLVIDIITSGGNQDPPKWQRVFWATGEGVVAAVLLLAGGLAALQAAAIAAALPFSIVMLFVCWGLLRGLRMESWRRLSAEMPAPMHIRGAGVPWQQRLKTILHHPGRGAVERFLTETVRPALDEVAREIQDSGLAASVESDSEQVSLVVYHEEERDFVYSVCLRAYQAPSFAFSAVAGRRGTDDRYWRADVHLIDGSQDYDVMGHTKEQVIGDVLAQYQKHRHFLHIAAR